MITYLERDLLETSRMKCTQSEHKEIFQQRYIYCKINFFLNFSVMAHVSTHVSTDYKTTLNTEKQLICIDF